MAHFAVSAIGRDRPGIAAAISGVLVDVGGNIEDAHMSILRGHFAVMLIVAVPDGSDLDARLARVREELGLEAIAVSPVEDLQAGAGGATHVLTVYGADHPGIVHAVCSALAERGVNITDLQTRLAGSESSPIYLMLMEVAVPEGLDVAELGSSLEGVGEAAQVDVSLRELEAQAL